MTFSNLWPLGFLILIPIIVLLYILKQKVKDQPFSSALLWREIYKNLEARTPFEKLKHNILMYLQILAMLFLIFALMAPVIRNGGFVSRNTVIVIDTSASMETAYNGGKSRLEEAISRAKSYIDGVNDSGMITVVSCDDSAQIIYQGQDKSTAKRRIASLKTAMVSGTLDAATGMVGSLVSGLENVDVICYTDSEFDYSGLKRNYDRISLFVESIYSSEENLSVDYVNYAITADDILNASDETENASDSAPKGDQKKDTEYIEAICKVTNHGEKEETSDVSLYLDNDIVDVQTVNVKAKESETVYFSRVKLPKEWAGKIETDGSKKDSLKNPVLRAELSKKDSLTADNISSVAVTHESDRKILLISKGNVFMEKALSLSDGATVYKADDVNVLKDAEDFNLYVFDGVDFPADFDEGMIPKNASVFLINYDNSPKGFGYIKESGTVSDCMLHFEKTDLTEYVDKYSFGVSKAYTYSLYDWANPIVTTDDGKAAGYYGYASASAEGEGGGDTALDALDSVKDRRRVAVLGFDIHNTDLALQTEFPIFMSELTEYLLNGNDAAIDIRNFPIDESEVIPIENVSVKGILNKTKTGGRAIRNILLVVAIIILIIEWIIYHIQVHSGKKKQFLVVRGILLAVILLAISGVSITKKQKKIETIFLVDVSDSMSGNLTEVEKYLKTNLALMPKKHQAGVVAFGKNSSVEQFISSRKDFAGISGSTVTTATNIERGVTAACSMFHDGVTKRLVLITDGCENEGSLSLAASMMKNSDVELLVIHMDDTVVQNDEVYIDGLDTPSVIHVGDHYNITVSIKSNVETDALLTLYSGRTSKGQKKIHLTKGSNQFIFEDMGAEGAIAQYKAVIEPDKDTLSVNNTYVTFSQIEAQPKVLIVEGKGKNAEEFEKVLTAANIGYDTVSPGAVPVSLSQLITYKAIITIDAYYDDFRDGFASNLEAYVKDYAGGYICIGGDNSFALGRYRNTELEEILPVYMDPEGEREIPKMAMVMVIDQSGSMASPSEDDTTVTGLDLAKQAAVSGVRELRETDEVGVLAFDDKYNWTVPITRADDTDAIEDKIRTIGNGGGTSIYPALEEAYAKLLKSDAKLKHIILLTDGQDEFSDYDALLSQINDAGITVSCVAVGSESDRNRLKMISDNCGGRFYYTDINNSIPRIFAKEVYLSTNEYLINEEFYPEITSNNQILEGVMDEGCPALLGYIASRPKERADVILTSPKGDPVLSTWQCGLGRTVAWNSDATNEWTAAYGAWENYPLLWSNIIHYCMTDNDLSGDDLDIVSSGNSASIIYETAEADKNTVVTAAVSDENGNTKEITLDPMKPGSYQAEIEAEDIGIYNINIRKKNGDKVVKNYNTAFAKQYSPEYRFNDNFGELDRFVKQVDGRNIKFEDDVFKADAKKVSGKIPLTVFLIILSMGLLLFDIVIRRFSVDVAGNIKAAVTGIAGRSKRQKRIKKVNKKAAEKGDNEADNKKQREQHDDEQKEQQNEKQKEQQNEKHKEKQNEKQNEKHREKQNQKQNEKYNKKQNKKQKSMTTEGSDTNNKSSSDSGSELLDMNALLQKKKDRS